MTTIRSCIRQADKKKDGTCPIFICITKDSLKAYIHSGHYSLPKDWAGSLPKSSHPHYQRLTAFLISRQSAIMDRVLEEEQKNPDITSRQLKDLLSRKIGESFFGYAERFIEAFNNPNQQATYKRYKANIANLKGFAPTLQFSELTFELLRKYEKYLHKEGKMPNTIAGQMKAIRAILYAAYKDGVANRNNNPFEHYKLKWEEGSIGWLTIKELEAIRNAELHDIMASAARDIFMFQFYCMGMRISDALSLTLKNVVDDSIVFRAIKGAKVSQVELMEEARAIIDNYSSTGYIFPFLAHCKEIGAATAMVNKYLKDVAIAAGINKRLTTHMARHTWASMAIQKGIHMRLVQGALRHGDYATTERYARKFNNKELAEANRKIIG